MKKVLLFQLMLSLLPAAYSQNVGIGVANPLQKLHVGGNVRVDGFATPGNGIITANANGDLLRTNFTGNSQQVLKGDGSFGTVASSALPSGAIVGSSNSIDSNLLNAGFSFYGEMPENAFSFIERPANTSLQYDQLPMYDKGKPGAIGPPSGRSNFSSAWSGSEMLVWGGVTITNDVTYGLFNDGKKYNPNTDSWTAINAINAPVRRGSASTVWTGTEMIVWGGYDSVTLLPSQVVFNFTNSGGKYNPTTNSWTSVTQVGAPTARSSAAAVWTGTQMIIWGGVGVAGSLSTGSRYNPISNSWLSTTIVGAPVSAGSNTRMFWDAASGYAIVLANGTTGGRYNPVTNTWLAMASCPVTYERQSAVWTGTQLIVFSALNHTMYKYSPATNTWATAITTGDYPDNSENLSDAVWTGFEVVYFVRTNYDGSSSNWIFRFNNGTNAFEQSRQIHANTAVSSGYNFLMAGSLVLKWGGELSYSGLSTFKQTTEGLRYYLSAGISYPPYYFRSSINNTIYLYKKN